MLTLTQLTLTQLALLCGGALIGGMVFGIAGFAFGVIASLFLHHGFAAADVVFIVVSGALVLNLSLLPRFWRDIDLRRALPYIAGGACGLPVGLLLLLRLEAGTVRTVVSVLLILYCFYALRQQSREPLRLPARGGLVADTGIGLVGGMIGGVSGLGPLVPGIWFGLRGLTKQQQRALTQPFGLFIQGAMVAWFMASGAVSTQAVHGIVLAAPLMVAAAWAGLRLFDALSTAVFQRIVIACALVGAGFLLLQQF